MHKIRLGIIGSGFMGQTHAAAAARLDEFELIAVAGGTRAARLAEAHSASLSPTVQALVKRSDIDAVIVTSPHAFHSEQGLEALRHGKHCLIEKPLTTTVGTGVQLKHEAESRGLTLTVGYHQRFRENVRRARGLIRAGEIGRVDTIQISMPLHWSASRSSKNSFGSDWSWWNDPASVGHLLNSGPHAVDLLRWFLDAEVSEVFAYCVSLRETSQVEDTTMALLRMNCGAIASLYSSNALPSASFPGEEFRFRLVGSKALLDLDPYGDLRIGSEAGWRVASTQQHVGHESSSTAFGESRLQAYCDQLKSFAACISGEPADCGTADDGIAGVAACLAMLQSSRRKALVRL
jgi:predicted dehydrogenase